MFADKINQKHEFHDTNLSPFVKSARHAVAIDEVRDEFEPTPWTNVDALNRDLGVEPDNIDAPYQQKWFPGVHSSVGGGADWRGLSDQALHWVWIGAMRMGLKFDTSQNSRIFELAPKFTEKLVHGDDPSLSYRVMAARGNAHKNGPTHLYEVSYSAQRRWHESPDMLADGVLYRPDTLKKVSESLDGLANLFVFLDANRPWRRVKVTERRTAADFAVCMRELADLHYPKAERIRIVLDNLSTHSPAALYQTFPADEARRLLRRIEFHYTPKHASWLNMVEIEIGVLASQCLDRRIESYSSLVAEVAAWEKQRNAARARVVWSFTTEKARAKMGRAYPRPTNLTRPQRVKTSVPRY